MKIGLLDDPKADEYRVALSPDEVFELTRAGHEVHFVAGIGSDLDCYTDYTDKAYIKAGGIRRANRDEVFENCQLLVRVKSLLPDEFHLLNPEHILFMNLHPAADRRLVNALLESRCMAIAAEECHVMGSSNCQYAGEVGALLGLKYSMRTFGGMGYHPCDLKVLVLGAGQTAKGVIRTISKFNPDSLIVVYKSDTQNAREMMFHYEDRLKFIDMKEFISGNYLFGADLVFNCTLWDKLSKYHLVTGSDVAAMKNGSVIVDISCDEAGAIETSRPTTWEEPSYILNGVVHVCIDNLPSAFAVRASEEYADMIYDQVLALANYGKNALDKMPVLRKGLATMDGKTRMLEVARVQGRII